MRAGLTTSVILHGVALAFGLFSLSAPAALPSADESLAVDIVPVESLAKVQQGDKKSVMREKPAPLPTQRPDVVADAQKVGENSVDTDKPVTPEATPTPVDTTSAPPPAPTPKEQVKTEDVPKPKEEPKPVAATQVAPVPAPKEEVKPEPVKQPDPKPEPIKEPEPKPTPPEEKTAALQPQPDVKPDAVSEAIAAEPPAEEVKVPDAAPAPDARPKPEPAQAETAKAPDRKDSDKPVKEASSRAKSDDKEFNADQISALLNKQKPSGGGAKRSTQQASLGGDKTTGEKLSQSEMGALSDQLGNCWTIPIGMEDGSDLRVVIKFNVNSDKTLQGRPEVQTSSGNRQFDESAVRAVQKCNQQGLILPAGKQDIWSEVVVNFDPKDMGM